MADIVIPKSDKGFDLNFTVQDSDGDSVNLTAYTIKLIVWKKGMSDSVLMSGTCVIVSAVAGTCKYTVTASDFIVVGIYRMELELTKSGVIESTRNYILEVTDSPTV